jgi:hypothetical protein
MYVVVANLFEGGVPDLWMSLVRHFFPALMVYGFMYKLLPNRLNIYALIALALVYTLWCNLRTPDLYGTSYHFWMNIFINVWTYFIIICLFQGKFWKKFIIWWYFDVVKTLSEAVAYAPILLYSAYRGFRGEQSETVLSAESDIMPKLLYMFIFFTLFALLGLLSVALWRRLLLKKFQPFYLLFIVLPMGLRYSLSQVFRPNMGDWFFGILINFTHDVETIYAGLSLFGIALGLVASVTTLYYVLSYDKRAAIEAELRDAKRAMELEQARSGEAEARSEELAKIRHDFNNQLASVIQLVRAREDGTAREIITALTKEINGARNG